MNFATVMSVGALLIVIVAGCGGSATVAPAQEPPTVSTSAPAIDTLPTGQQKKSSAKFL